jgi:MoxR-like ATPase
MLGISGEDRVEFLEGLLDLGLELVVDLALGHDVARDLGVFLLDEMDAADPNVLLVINSALANKRMAVSSRPAKPYAIRHKNFVCIAAANTVGTGADRLYSGRNKLDAATLDRFAIGKVFMDYDPALETALCPDNELRELFLNYRNKVRTHRMERSMSTRFLQDAYEMKTEAEWTIEEIQEAFFEGWRDDEKNKVMAR